MVICPTQATRWIPNIHVSIPHRRGSTVSLESKFFICCSKWLLFWQIWGKLSTYPRACCSRFHFWSIVPGVRLFKLLSNDEEFCSWDDDKHLKWERSRVSSSHDTVIPKTKIMTKISNIIGAPVVGVLGNCDKETWTMNWNKLVTDLFSLHCFLTIRDVGTFSLSFHNLCSTMHAQRMKFQRHYSLLCWEKM